MTLLAWEHSKPIYWADFAFYGAAVVLLLAALAWEAPAGQGLWLAVLAAVGLFGWTLLEYLIHRFLLHHVQPFRHWHDAHHERPHALIATPTLVSATLLFGLVALPAWLVFGRWPGLALTLGVLTGYLAYTLTHHATHHSKVHVGWLQHRKRAHALHHHLDRPVEFGVTTGLWDVVFGTRVDSRER